MEERRASTPVVVSSRLTRHPTYSDVNLTIKDGAQGRQEHFLAL